MLLFPKGKYLVYITANNAAESMFFFYCNKSGTCNYFRRQILESRKMMHNFGITLRNGEVCELFDSQISSAYLTVTADTEHPNPTYLASCSSCWARGSSWGTGLLYQR